MREILWCFKNTTFKSKKYDSDDHRHHQHATGLTTCLLNFMKPRCLGKSMKRKKRQLNEKEKQQHSLKKNNNNTTHQLTTLEEWIMASPCLNRSFTKQDNFHGNSKENHNKVCPSFDDDHEDPGKYISIQKLMKVDESKSLKGKKRVSFRLPVVADIFILQDSPEVVLQNL